MSGLHECRRDGGCLALDGIIGCQARYQSEVERFLSGEATVEQEQFLRPPHPDHARQEPGIAAIGRQAERAVAECEPCCWISKLALRPCG